MVSNLNLTDVWTCYKAMRTSLLKSIPLVSNDFRIEPELTIKLAKRNARIFEIPIRYAGRTYAEGKKIGFRDAFLGIWAVVRFGVRDDIYTDDKYGSQILSRLARARRFNAWMAEVIKPFCGERVLEVGAGTGNLTLELTPRSQYVTSDNNPLYLTSLENLCSSRPYLRASFCDVTDARTFPADQGGYDTVICLNVLEHLEDDRGALMNLRRALTAEGRAIVLVPNGPWNFGTLDRVLGHRRRYTKQSLRALTEECGFHIERLIMFNRVGTVAWFLNGKLLRRRHFGMAQIWLLNLITQLVKILDPMIPLPALSIIAILRPASERVAHRDPNRLAQTAERATQQVWGV
jgi:2-polyprenyl-3-methyl-5-hydroxy-6-metoxy-1,4-benzoquinol methylase